MCALLLITPIIRPPGCQAAVSGYLNPGFLCLNPQVKVMSKADKGTKTKGNTAERFTQLNNELI